jgi:hypothetical protein
MPNVDVAQQASNEHRLDEVADALDNARAEAAKAT